MNRFISCTLLLFCSCSSALAEPLNYDYVYLSKSEVDQDGTNETAEGETFGAFYSFRESLHGFASIDDAGSYAAVNGDARTLRVGVGGHFLVSERFMIAPAIAALYTRTKYYDWQMNRQEDSDTGYVLQLDARWQFLDRWELIGGVHRSSVFNTDDTEIVAGLLWHPLDWLALGAIHKDKSEATGTELTARWYF